jgi:hypothetical protein
MFLLVVSLDSTVLCEIYNLLFNFFQHEEKLFQHKKRSIILIIISNKGLVAQDALCTLLQLSKS